MLLDFLYYGSTHICLGWDIGNIKSTARMLIQNIGLDKVEKIRPQIYQWAMAP